MVENIFSFGDRTEFNMIPGKEQNLNEHKYKRGKLELLKMAAIYGANGAGKSNLVKVFGLLKQAVKADRIPLEIAKNKFKLDDNSNKGQLIAVEFFINQKAYYYAFKVKENIVAVEELYESGLGTKNDKLIYERITTKNNKTTIKFNDKFEKNEKIKLIKEVLIHEFVKPNGTVLKLLAKRENESFIEIKNVYDWFDNNLEIIYPSSKIAGLPIRIERESEFKKYLEENFKSIGLGINGLKTETKSLDSEAKSNNFTKEEIEQLIHNNSEKYLGLSNENGEIIFVKENGEIKTKRLKLIHEDLDKNAEFYLEEESDGTRRLLDLIPAFMELLTKNKVVVIDEIERSIHPVLIKELISKFSKDNNIKGQLIFTTHETNLLDQKIIRRDEVWFAEKNKEGKTELYSLDEYKEHKTIDIRKGYLGGRYGSIPILGELQELNWNEYAAND